MPKSVSRLNLAEKHDKEAEQHVRKAIEWEEAAVNAATPADREKYGEKARLAARGATLFFCVAEFISEIAMIPRPSES